MKLPSQRGVYEAGGMVAGDKVDAIYSDLRGWSAGRLTQFEVAQIPDVCERGFRRQLVKYDEGRFNVPTKRRLNQLCKYQAKALASLYRTSSSSYNERYFHQRYEATIAALRSYNWVSKVL